MVNKVKEAKNYEATEFGGRSGLDSGNIAEGGKPTTIQELQGMIANDSSDPGARSDYDPNRIGRPDKYLKKDWKS